MAIMRHKYAYKTSSRRQVEKNNVFFMYVFKVIFFFFFVKTHSFLKRRYNFALLMGQKFRLCARVFTTLIFFANIRISSHFSSPPDFSLVVIKRS